MGTTPRSTQIAFADLVGRATADGPPAVRRSRSLARGHAVVVVRFHADGGPTCSVQLGPGATLRAVLLTLGSLACFGAAGPRCRVHGYVDRTALRSVGPV